MEKTVDVEEYTTTQCDFTPVALPVYTVSGTVKDVAGDPVEGATVALTGYDTKDALTNADGKFCFKNVFKNSNYSVAVNKNKLLEATRNFGVEADTDLGDITLDDNIKAAQKVVVSTTSGNAEIAWNAPANDAVVQRIDDGTLTTSVGVSGGNSNTMFGVVKREPAQVSGVQFYIDGTSSVTHYSVALTIFDLDENGEPAQNILYQNSYVSATDGQWNSYTLPAPVDAPNGYYIALSYYDYLLVGIDGDGDSERYPFVQHVNCFTQDYTSGKFYYLDDQSSTKFHHNFLIRPVAAPMSVAEDSTEFKAPRFIKHIQAMDVQPELQSVDAKTSKITDPETKSVIKKTIQQRMRYNVYRMKSADIANEQAWQLISEKQQARDYTDTDWASLEQGTYAYAVKAVYTGDKMADAAMSDIIGNKMLTKLTFHITTATPENEAYGARVFLIADGGEHVAEGIADDNGDITISDVWKTKYDITVSLDGFISQTGTVDVSLDDAYLFNYKLEEDRIQPTNLYVEDGETADSKRFAWNYPDVFFDDFEGHDDFAINSPGSIGWQYIDGDGAETGAVYNYTWAGIGSPMAYMVFNASATTPSVKYMGLNLEAYSGEKCLTDWAAYQVPNDDWIITPQLHFQKDFKFSFYAAGIDYSYPETFEVLYSTTDAQPMSFVTVDEQKQTSSWFQYYEFDIPKEAKYVAIHCVSDQKRVFRVDDVMFGLSEAMQIPYYLRRSAQRPMKSPAIDGLYEVYLDGKLVAQQDETSYLFERLAEGKHTAGVVASYTSGKTDMSTIDFTVSKATGIELLDGNRTSISLDGDILKVSSDCNGVTVYSVDGKALPIVRVTDGTYRICGATGTMIIKVETPNGVKTIKTNTK